jgi:hypothetical protein
MMRAPKFGKFFPATKFYLVDQLCNCFIKQLWQISFLNDCSSSQTFPQKFQNYNR